MKNEPSLYDSIRFALHMIHTFTGHRVVPLPPHTVANTRRVCWSVRGFSHSLGESKIDTSLFLTCDISNNNKLG